MLRNKGIWGLIGIIGLSLLISGEVMGKEPLKAEALEKKGTQTIEEKYVRKELISFTWGTGTYQLGSNWRKYLDEDGNYIGPEDAWTETTGPSFIKVNKKGDVFIWDTANKRISIFDKNGKFLKFFNPHWLSNIADFDEQNNLYMVMETVPFFVQKYDSSLKLVKEFFCERPIGKEFGTARPIKFFIDKNGKFNFITDYRKIFQVDIATKEREKYIRSNKIKYFPIIYSSKTEKFWEQNQKEISIILPKSGKKIRYSLNIEEKHCWISEIIGENRRGDIFILLNISKIIGEKSKEIVHKYSLNGEFLTEIHLDIVDRLFATQEESGSFWDIDDEGNIYHLWIQKEGPKLVKWERKK